MIAFLLLAASAGWTGPAPVTRSMAAIDLRPATVAAFQRHIEAVETRVAGRAADGKTFLWVDESPARRARVRRGEVVIERSAGSKPVEVPDGLVHDFTGAVFIPGVTLARTLAFVQDYDHHKDYYGPEVMDSRITSRDGEHFVLYMRLKKKKVITVVLDTEHDAQFFPLDKTRWHSRSRTTKVAQVENPGTPQERVLPAGTGGGYMWALNSYWRFVERDGGVYVECRAVSLSRGIPWLAKMMLFIAPIVNDLPRESLENTLLATRTGVLGRATTPR